MTCRHLTRTDLWCIHDDGSEEHVPGGAALCDWGDNHPERFVDAPRWLTGWALSGGPNFVPERDCPGCPGYATIPAINPGGRDR